MMARLRWAVVLGIGGMLLGCSSTRANDTPRPREQPPAATRQQDSTAPQQAPSPALPFRWPVPPGWRAETIPFPLEFAPDIPFQGLEELRFMPDFFEPTSQRFWSYAFVWWLEGNPDLSREALERALVRYFLGLARAVGKDKYPLQPAEFSAQLQEPPPHPLALTQRRHLSGQVRAFDAFKTGRYLTLHLDVQVGLCAEPARRVVWVRASPKPRPHPLWTELDALLQSFDCRPAIGPE